MHTSGCRHIPNSSSAIVGGSRKKGGVRIESAGNDTPTVALKAREHPGDTSGHVCVAKSFVWCNYYLQKTRAARFPLPNIPFRLRDKKPARNWEISADLRSRSASQLSRCSRFRRNSLSAVRDIHQRHENASAMRPPRGGAALVYGRRRRGRRLPLPRAPVDGGIRRRMAHPPRHRQIGGTAGAGQPKHFQAVRTDFSASIIARERA